MLCIPTVGWLLSRRRGKRKRRALHQQKKNLDGVIPPPPFSFFYARTPPLLRRKNRSTQKIITGGVTVLPFGCDTVKTSCRTSRRPLLSAVSPTVARSMVSVFPCRPIVYRRASPTTRLPDSRWAITLGPEIKENSKTKKKTGKRLKKNKT